MAKKKPFDTKKYGYCVVQRSFGYDDSHHNAEDGGTPEIVFTDLKLAKAEAVKRTASWLKGMELGTWSEQVLDLTTKADTEQELAEKFDKIIKRKTENITVVNGDYSYVVEVGDYNYFDVPSDLKEEQYLKIAKLFDQLQPYYVLRVELA